MKPVNAKRFNLVSFATATAATALAGLLAACGGGSESEPVAATVPPVAVTATQIAPTPPAPRPAVIDTVASAGQVTTLAVPPVVSPVVSLLAPPLAPPTSPPLLQPVDIQLPWNGNAKSPEVFESLLTYARVKGAAPMTVYLDRVNLALINEPATKAFLKDRLAKLRAELGDTAWELGYSESGLTLGMIHVNLTEAGLRIMRDSPNVFSYSVGSTWMSDLYALDDRLKAIEAQFDGTRQYVPIRVTLNVDGLEYDLEAQGRYKAWANAPDAVARQALALLARFKPSELRGQDAVMAQYQALMTQSGTTDKVEFTLEFSRQGLLRLAADKDVRTLSPPGFIDTRPLYFDDRLFAYAEKYGKASVELPLRYPLLSSRLSKASEQAQERASQRAYADIFIKAGIDTGQPAAPFSPFDFLNLTVAQLLKLRDLADIRLYGVLRVTTATPASVP